MHTGWNKKSIGTEQPFLESVAGAKRNTKEGDTCENQFEGEILRIKSGRQDVKKPRFFRALMCYLVALMEITLSSIIFLGPVQHFCRGPRMAL